MHHHFLLDTTSTSCNISRVKLTLSKNYEESLEFIENKVEIFRKSSVSKAEFINYLAENIQNRIKALQFEREITSRFTEPSDVYEVAPGHY